MEKRTTGSRFRRYVALAYSHRRTRLQQKQRPRRDGFVPPGPLFDAGVVALLLVFGSLYFFT